MKAKIQNIKRREILRMLAGASILPLIPLSACSEKKAIETGNENVGDTDTDENQSETNEPSEENITEDTGAQDTAETEDTGETIESGIDENTGWATGGTANMPDKAAYPDPFLTAVGECLLLGPTTLGPCTVEEEFDREDVSEGWDGVPLRLGLKIMDESCNPVAGAKVKIWHTGYSGSYSGQTPHNDACLMNADFANQNFFRGYQTTDSNGIVFFDTCFPGRYQGRVIHIHIDIINGLSSYASQLLFPEDIAHDICGNHALYRAFGIPDVTFQTDRVLDDISEEKLDRNILTIERMTDGVMLGSKIITVAV